MSGQPPASGPVGLEPVGGIDPVTLDPVVVGTGPSGYDQVLDWLGHAWRVEWGANGLPRAMLDVRLAEGLLVNTGSDDQPVLKPIHEAIGDDELITLRTAREDPETDALLFSGFVETIRRDATPPSGGAGRPSNSAEKAAELQLIHVGDVLRRGRGQWLSGQARPSKAELEAPPAEWRPRLYTALDAVFNPDGVGNCMGDPVRIAGQPEGSARVNLFAERRLHGTQSWSWVRVLVYLAYLARRNPDGSLAQQWTEYDFRLWNLDELAYGREELDPDSFGPEPDGNAWTRVLLGKPRNHVIEGLSWLEAWSWTCAQAGLGYVWEARWCADVQAHRWGIRLFVPGTWQMGFDPNQPHFVSVQLASPHYRVAGRTLEEIRAANNVTGIHLDESFGPVVNEVTLRGAPVKYEATVELVPGWALDSWWDVDPADPDAVDTAVARIGSDEWRARYDSDGADFLAGGYWPVGRLWGLNTTGAWSDYGRPWSGHPFHGTSEAPGAYALFDLADVQAGEVQDGPGVFVRGLSCPRRRPFEPCVSRLSELSPRPPVVEASFDGGASWQLLPAQPRILRHDARVYFEVTSLADVMAREGSISFAEAYVRGLLRVRITAGLHGDLALGEVLGGTVYVSGASRAQRQRHRRLPRAHELALEIRDDVTIGGQPFSGGNSQWKDNPAFPTLARDSRDEAARSAREFVARYDRVTFRGPIQLSELRFPLFGPNGVSGYRPGDLLVGIMSEQAHSEHTLVPLPSESEFGAMIAGVAWQYRSDPPAAGTTLLIEDAQQVVRSRHA